MGLEIVITGFGIIIISTITNGVSICKFLFVFSAYYSLHVSPFVIGVRYQLNSVLINNSKNITKLVCQVKILGAVINKSYRCSVFVVLEIPGICSVCPGQDYSVTRIEIRCYSVYGFACSYSVFVITTVIFNPKELVLLSVGL